MTTYTTNHDFFEQINTPEKAYMLGFITGDGNIFKRSSWVLQFTLHEQDIEILENIRQRISPEKPIYKWMMTQVTGHQTPCVALRITSNKIGEDLIKLGITPNKTGKENFATLAEELYPDYIRGIFDADGSLAIITDRNSTKYKFSIRCKNREFLQKIRNKLKYGSIFNFDGCPVLEICKRYDVCKTGKYLYYSNNVLCLSRKKKRFDDMPKPYLFEAFGEIKTYRDWLKDGRMVTKQSNFYRRINNTNLTLEECMTAPLGTFANECGNRKITRMGVYPIEEFPKIGDF